MYFKMSKQYILNTQQIKNIKKFNGKSKSNFYLKVIYNFVIKREATYYQTV